jgi:hypothetical protein
MPFFIGAHGRIHHHARLPDGDVRVAPAVVRV